MKMFKGLLDSLYKKWELYLFRLFQLAKYIEDQKKYSFIKSPPLSEILDPRGYNGYVRIPPNPFFLRENDKEFFYWVFDDFTCESESAKEISRLFIEIWDRIGFVKRFLGITRNTRFCGQEDSEKRLVNEIDIYIEYPEACSPLNSLIMGQLPEDEKERADIIEVLKQFQNFLLDREPIRKGNVKSYEHYR